MTAALPLGWLGRQRFGSGLLIAENGEDKIKIIAIRGLVDPDLAAVGFHHVADEVKAPPGAHLAFDITARDSLPRR